MKRIISLFPSFLILCCGGVLAQTAGPGLPAVYYASKSGARLDCIPLTGLTAAGGACTNNDAVLNGILATATATHPVTLIVDGGTITNGIVGPSTGYWSIDCLNTGNGFFMAANNTAGGISNSAYHSQGSPGTAGNNIQIHNCSLNGNYANQSASCCGSAASGIYLDNMVNVAIDNVFLYKVRFFNVLLNACASCTVTNSRMDDTANLAGGNGDPVHVDGPSSNIRISNVDLVSNDDGIALNAAEGYTGNISDVSISGEQCHPCLSFFRALSDETSDGTNDLVTNVNFTNGSGTVQDSSFGALGVFDIGFIHSNTSNLDLMGPFNISNTTAQTLSTDTAMVYLEDNVSTLSMNNVTWIAPAGAQPWLANSASYPATVSSFLCTACRIYRNAAAHAAAWWATVVNGETIKRFECNGCSVENEQGQSYSALSYALDVQSGGAIGSLVLTDLDPTLAPTLLNGNEWSRITNFYGAGVSTYYSNTTFANLPPATYKGLAASIRDSTTQTWGATAAGSSSSYAAVTSDGTNWTVTGK